MVKERFVASSYNEAAELEFRQEQFGALLGLDPELLRGLKFCKICKGFDYQWTNWSQTEVDGTLGLETPEDAYDYRIYLLDQKCTDCDGSGFEGGNFELLNKEGWLNLSAC